MNLPIIILLIALLALSSISLVAAKADNPDQKYRDYLSDFMRVRGDASGNDVVYYWTGTIYSFVPGEKKQELFKFEGFNIAKTVKTEEGFQLLTREAAFYEDPKTGEILDVWKSPFIRREVPVVHIWNDPVNQDISFPKEYLPMIDKFLPSTDLGDIRCFNMEIFPFYDTPLSRDKYPEFSQNDKYQAGEFFQFFVNKKDLKKKKLTTVPTTISWTRVSPWMPFMQMADRPGQLLFVCRGMKLAKGFTDLPAKLQTYVKNNHPEYQTAPTEWSEPNETSWTYFKKLIEKGLYPPKQK